MNDPPAKGGRIPGFKTFKFKPLSFEGFKFDKTEFVGFEFEGFDQSQNLAFKEVREIELEEADDPPFTDKAYFDLRMSIRVFTRIAEQIDFVMNLLSNSVCPFPLIVINGFGTDEGCVAWKGTKALLLNMVVIDRYLILLALVGMEEFYGEQYAPSEESQVKDQNRNEATYDMVTNLITGVNSNHKVINDNINTQHKQVRSTLESQHSTMMVSSFTAFLHSITKRSNGRRLHVGLILNALLTHRPDLSQFPPFTGTSFDSTFQDWTSGRYSGHCFSY